MFNTRRFNFEFELTLLPVLGKLLAGYSSLPCWGFPLRPGDWGDLHVQIHERVIVVGNKGTFRHFRSVPIYQPWYFCVSGRNLRTTCKIVSKSWNQAIIRQFMNYRRCTDDLLAANLRLSTFPEFGGCNTTQRKFPILGHVIRVQDV